MNLTFKKNKGFTLIELLAVIVILAIIALIATPIILGVVESAKKGAAKEGINGYLDAVEKTVALNLIKDDTTLHIEDGAYTIEQLDVKGVAVKGEKPEAGWVIIKNKVVANYSLKLQGFYFNFGEEPTKDGEIAEIPGIPKLCMPVTVTQSKVYTVGDKYECELNDTEKGIFYVIGSDNEAVDLIYEKNYGSTYKWATGSTNTNGPLVLLEQLSNITTLWTKLNDIPTSRNLVNVQTSGGKYYSIDYTNYKVRLITKDEATSIKSYPWSYANLKTSPPYGGYWTANTDSSSSYYAFYLSANPGNPASILSGSVDYGNYYGIRPVISVTKSNI